MEFGIQRADMVLAISVDFRPVASINIDLRKRPVAD
jgi:hypothetical protein